MPTLFQQLENNEAMLLMYLAGELPAADMSEVEQMLSRDAGLRAELEQIRSAQEIVFAGFAELDAAEEKASSMQLAQAAAVRNVGRMMRQWKVDRLRAAPLEPQRRRLRLPAWTYPAGAVASVLVGALIYWGIKGGAPAPAVGPNQGYADVNAPKPTAVDTTKLLTSSLATDDSNPIDDAESQASSIIARSDDASVTGSIFLSENGQ